MTASFSATLVRALVPTAIGRLTLVPLVFTVLLCYEFVLNFADEVEFIWRRKLSAASIIFFINRIAAVITAFVMMSENFGRVRTHSCIQHITQSLTLS